MNSPTQRPYLWLFGLLAVVGLVGDQASKYGIFTYLYSEELFLPTPAIAVVPGVFQLEASHVQVRTDGAHIQYYLQRDPGNQPLSPLRTVSGPCLPHVNRGALFGIGNGDQDSGGMNYLFALISVVAAFFIVIWGTRAAVARDRLLSVSLGLILGGTLGNLYDRLVFGGVRDFMHWYWGYNWPVFNFADCCLVCGAFALLAHSIFVSEKAAEPASEAAQAETVQTETSFQATAPSNGV